MAKNAVSVTLDIENILWLKGKSAAGQTRGVSETLNRIVTAARTSGKAQPGTVRSVVGTIEIHPDDPNLEQADAYIQSLFDSSLSRPVFARETPPTYGTSRNGGRKRG